MASIQFRTKGGEYYAFYRSSEGRRTSRNTGTRNRREALRIAKQWEYEAKRATDVPERPVVRTVISFGSATKTRSDPHPRRRWYFLPDVQAIIEASASREQAGSQPSEETTASESGFEQVKAKRLPQLKEAVMQDRADRQLASAMRSVANEAGFPLDPPRPMSEREHKALVAEIWRDFIKRKEPCAWGQRWLNAAGGIDSERVTDIQIHETVPLFPSGRIRPGAVPVIVRLDTADFASSGAEELETESAGSATAILECRSDEKGPLPDDHPEAIDTVFVMIDIAEKRAMAHLRATETNADDHAAQRDIAEEVLRGVRLLRCEAWKLFTGHAKSSAESSSGWLRFAGYCMWLGGRAEELEAMLPHSAEVAATTARKLIKGKMVGGQANSERKRIIKKMASLHREHPRLTCTQVLKRLGIMKKHPPDTNKPETYVIPGKGERKLSTLREWWTAAMDSVKKDSGSPRDPEC